MSEQRQDKNLLSEPHKTESDEIEIDLVDIFRKIIAIRKKLYKAVGIGFIIGIIVAVSIPKQYTVKVTLSPEMGNAKGSNGLAGLTVGEDEELETQYKRFINGKSDRKHNYWRIYGGDVELRRWFGRRAVDTLIRR